MSFVCTKCNYSTNRVRDYDRHCKSIKHCNKTSIDNTKYNDRLKEDDDIYTRGADKMICIGCIKSFKNKQTYSRHINKCERYKERRESDQRYLNGLNKERIIDKI